MNQRDKHESKSACPALQSEIDKLTWAGNALKSIPNLPKGKFRDHIDAEVKAIIAYKNSPLEESLESVKLLQASLDPLHVLCRELRDQKRLSSDKLTQLASLASKACLDLQTVRDTHY